jgi:phosphoserine phosphatase
VQEVERNTEAELSIVLQKTGRTERLALFDMDGVLLSDRFIVRLAERSQKLRELSNFLDKQAFSADERTRRIAGLFAGIPKRVFEETARQIPLIRGARDTVVGLRKAGFRVGIVTDSFRVVSEIVRRRVFADFSIAHLMKFCRGVATGEVTLSPAMVHPDGCPHHPHCKRNAMLHLIGKMGIGPEKVLAVGDSENDVCLLEAAGESVAYCPTSKKVRDAARHVVRGDLSQVLDIVLKQNPLVVSRWGRDGLSPELRPTFAAPARQRGAEARDRRDPRS